MSPTFHCHQQQQKQQQHFQHQPPPTRSANTTTSPSFFSPGRRGPTGLMRWLEELEASVVGFSDVDRYPRSSRGRSRSPIRSVPATPPQEWTRQSLLTVRAWAENENGSRRDGPRTPLEETEMDNVVAAKMVVTAARRAVELLPGPDAEEAVTVDEIAFTIPEIDIPSDLISQRPSHVPSAGIIVGERGGHGDLHGPRGTMPPTHFPSPSPSPFPSPSPSPFPFPSPFLGGDGVGADVVVVAAATRRRRSGPAAPPVSCATRAGCRRASELRRWGRA